MHADTQLHARQRHDGEIPASWLKGDTPFQKAAVLAAVAWAEVKPPEDPQFIHTDLTFREQCIGIAESIMRGNDPDDTPFARKVLELWKQTDDYNAQHPVKGKEINHD
jgi:hypothetical protein